jgi:hypothetical protein
MNDELTSVGVERQDALRCVQLSRSALRRPFLLFVATITSHMLSQVVCGPGSISLWTVIFLSLSVKGALQAYVRKTVILDGGIAHRTMFGRKMVFEYSEMCVLESKEHATITIIVGDDEIALDGHEADLSDLSSLLRQRVPKYLLVG